MTQVRPTGRPEAFQVAYLRLIARRRSSPPTPSNYGLRSGEARALRDEVDSLAERIIADAQEQEQQMRREAS